MTPDPELDDLIVSYLTGAIDAEGLARLDRRLRDDPAARDRFAGLAGQDVALASAPSWPAA